jgi:dienelactone hydrolase
MLLRRPLLLALCLCAAVAIPFAAEPVAEPQSILRGYFATETQRLERESSLVTLRTREDWLERRPRYQQELREMLGLLPYPEKTDLRATITGRLEHEEFFVEKLHFQSLPGLYVTANVYVPKHLTGRAPAILYVCGHSRQAEGAVSFGNKTAYQHHGGWFARHGYICLVVDTIQLGELQGLHHGTYREGMWWWNARGYTPVGVEVWNAIRALDYLQSRPDVDPEKLGMTGRSGGGAYTWYTAALDERVKVAVPVAGITDTRNHVVDGCVAGHCDCMYLVNTHRWDYGVLAALVAPRPLLIANSDKDPIFPLDGVVRLHREVGHVYRLHGAADRLGLLITEGPHKDTQDLQVPAFRWFNRFLKGEDPLIRVAAEKFFKPADLRVFSALPADERTTKAHEYFVPAAAHPVPTSRDGWLAQVENWGQALREKSFAGWPKDAAPLALAPSARHVAEPSGGRTWYFNAQEGVRLPFTVHAKVPVAAAKRVILRVVEPQEWDKENQQAAARAEVQNGEAAVIVFATRAQLTRGLTDKDRVQARRRYMLLGQTEDGMAVWDIGRAVAAVRSPELAGGKPLHVEGVRREAVNALYASLFTDGIAGLELIAPPTSHHQGPDYLNVLRILDVPQAVAMAAVRTPVKITGSDPDQWGWTRNAWQQLGAPPELITW